LFTNGGQHARTFPAFDHGAWIVGGFDTVFSVFVHHKCKISVRRATILILGHLLNLAMFAKDGVNVVLGDGRVEFVDEEFPHFAVLVITVGTAIDAILAFGIFMIHCFI